MEPEDEIFLRRAINLAAIARERAELPFGAVLVNNREIAYQAFDRCISQADPTAHAERLLISEYCHQNRLLDLDGFTIYCSAEPCVMCAGAIKWARISRVVFSVSQAMLQQLNGGKPKPSCSQIVNTGNRRIEVDGPWLAEEGLAVFAGYSFIPKRQR